MLRTTLALTGRLACFSASSNGLLSAVTWSCLELFTYVLYENLQEVTQNFGFLSKNHGLHDVCSRASLTAAIL